MDKKIATGPDPLSALNQLFLLLALFFLLSGTGNAAVTGIDANNSYFFSLTSYNSVGLESVYFSIVDNNEPTPPTVNVVTASDGTPASPVVSINVEAPASVGVTKVQLFVNGSQVAETATSPFAFSWDTSTLASGSYAVAVKALDASGNSALSENIDVTVGGMAAPLSLTDAQDALLIASGAAAPTGEQLVRLDVAPYIGGKSIPNGKIDTGDVVVILSKLVGKL